MPFCLRAIRRSSLPSQIHHEPVVVGFPGSTGKWWTLFRFDNGYNHLPIKAEWSHEIRSLEKNAVKCLGFGLANRISEMEIVKRAHFALDGLWYQQWYSDWNEMWTCDFREILCSRLIATQSPIFGHWFNIINCPGTQNAARIPTNHVDMATPARRPRTSNAAPSILARVAQRWRKCRSS
jgi:hypothetical protein